MGGRYFTIFASMRTGSNLLERTLGSYAGLRAEGELFNAHFIGQPGRTAHLGRGLHHRDEDPAGFLADVIREAAPDIPGFRLFDGHAPKMLALLQLESASAPSNIPVHLVTLPVRHALMSRSNDTAPANIPCMFATELVCHDFRG